MRTLHSLVIAIFFIAGIGIISTPTLAQTSTELAGNSLQGYPYFEYVRAFNEDSPVEVAIDPTRFPSISGVTADIYVVNAKASWSLGDLLVDAGTGKETFTFANDKIQSNRVTVATGYELDSDAGIGISVPYDVIIDVDRNGMLSSVDFIDGGGSEAGFYVVKDTVELGPLATTTITYSVSGVTSGFTYERTVYPTDIDSFGQLPLVVISHGNGHYYTWYDYLQQHLASHGYIVMSHQNNTVPGIETASTTTLEHTDAIIGQQATIAGGVLDGHIDSSRIVWIGHSRGGEGVARAYDRLFDGAYTPSYYDMNDIVLVVSIAPTDFLGRDSADPHDVPYHLIYGSADGDVSGVPNNDIADSFNVYERAKGFRHSSYVHGADHNVFNCCGFEDYQGPPSEKIGRAEAQRVAKGVILPMVKHYVEGDIPGKDFLWRQWERFKPISVAGTTTVVSEYKEGPDTGKFVIDDYQSEPSFYVSSSGGAVSTDVYSIAEGLLNDADGTFTWTTTDPMNGMTRARTNDLTRGQVFSVGANMGNFMKFEVVQGERDFSNKTYLSFRACQQTRHPLTILELEDLFWYVGLVDGDGNRKLINLSIYGGGIEEPFQRSGSGSGVGWQNEFETIRIRLTDFLTNGSGLDLTNITTVEFFFWESNTWPVIGRIGLDDVEVTVD